MTNLDLDAIEARAHEFCSVCDGSGTVSCWSPGGPCPEGQTVCETCGPCRQSDVPALVAALREARVGWAADYAVQDDRIGELQAERDDWRRRYEALRDGVTGLCAEAELRYGGTVVAGDLRAIVARVDES